MELNEYQEKAMTTCMASSDNFSYMMLNLVGEVGEFASKVAKQIRKEKMCVGGYCMKNDLIQDYKFDGMKDNPIGDELMKEAGDVLWQLAGLCKVMGWELEDVAKMNLEKLAARKKVGTIDGSGDGIVRDK